MHGAGLDLAQVEITQGKNTQRLEQGSSHALEGKDQGRFVGTNHHLLFLMDQEKPGKVLFLIFQSLKKNFPFIFGCGLVAGNRSRVLKPVAHYMFHASSRIVKSDWGNLPMLAKKVAALVQRDWMGEHLAKPS